MCLYLYIHNTYTQYTLIYYVTNLFDAINHDNRLTALKYYSSILKTFAI